MTRRVLRHVREDLRSRLDEACELPHVGYLAVWLGVIDRPPRWTRPTGIRTYQAVADAGLNAALETETPGAPDYFSEGMAWLQERQWFDPHNAQTLESDPMACLALAIGARARGEDEPTAWIRGFAARALERESEPDRISLFDLVMRLTSSSVPPSSVSPLLALACSAPLSHEPTRAECEAALDRILSPEPPALDWVIFHRAALEVLLRREATIDTVQPTIEQVAHVLHGIPAALRRWPWESKPRTTSAASTAQRWDIQSEYHVQSLAYAILRPIFADLEDEENLPSLGPKHPRADLAIPSLRLIIEVKYLRRATQSAWAGIVEEVSADVGLYLGDRTPYDRMIVLLWDSTGATNHHAEIVSGVAQLRGVVDTVIVSRPGQWTESM